MTDISGRVRRCWGGKACSIREAETPSFVRENSQPSRANLRVFSRELMSCRTQKNSMLVVRHWLLGARDTFPNFRPVHNCLPLSSPRQHSTCSAWSTSNALAFRTLSPPPFTSLALNSRCLIYFAGIADTALPTQFSYIPLSLVILDLAHASYRFCVPLAIWTSSNQSFSTLLNPCLQRPDFRSVFLLSLTGSAYFTLLTDRNHFYVSRYVRRVIKPSERSPRRSPLSLLIA